MASVTPIRLCVCIFAPLLLAGCIFQNSANEQCGDDARVHRATLTQAPADKSFVGDPVPTPVHLQASESLAAVLDDGDTVWFTTTGEEPLPSEVVELDPETGAIEAWVSWPEFASTDGSEIWMFVGDTEQRPDSEPMWEGYAGVWHFAERGTAGPFADGSPNGNDGDTPVSMALGDGFIGTSPVFDGEEHHIVVSDAPSLRNNEFTISAWVNRVADEAGAIVSKSLTNTETFRQSYGFAIGPNGNLIGVGTAVMSDTFSTFATPDATTLVPTEEWTRVTFTRDLDHGVELFVNGERTHDQAFNAEIEFDDGQLYIGARETRRGPEGLFNGQLDELTIEPVRRDANWIALSHRAERGEELGVGDFEPADDACVDP